MTVEAPSPRTEESAATEWWQLIRATYLTVDRRTLGLTRILLGAFLIFDLARRTPDWLDMYSDNGVLPSHLSLLRPQADNFSLFHAFSRPGELWALWGLGLAAYVCLLLGYRTKIAQVASLVFVTSMNGRVLLIENGGYVVQNLLLLWTCFLPLGDRFSLDALLASLHHPGREPLRERGERWRELPVVSLAVLAALLQLSAIYYFNVVHKTGGAWKNGTAVHYVLYNDRMATPFVGLVRDHLPLWSIRFLTKTTMVLEAAIPVCLLSPLARPWSRRAALAMICTLHIAFGSVFTLGPFAWSCCVLSTLLIGPEDWEIAARTMRRAHRARTLVVSAGSAAGLGLARLLGVLDRFELLRIEVGAKTTVPLALTRPGGERVTGAAAVGDVLAALPLGPVVAWMPRLPGVRHAIDAAMVIFARRQRSRRLEHGDVPTVADGSTAASSPCSRLVRRLRAGVREVGVAVMLTAAVNQAAVELWVFRPYHLPQPEPLRSLSHKLRFLQGWFMFSPNPVMDDGIVVCDAETIDGRHLDPFTGQPPRFDLGASVQFNQIWQDYMNRIQLPANAAYRDALRAWIERYHERTGRPEDRVVAARVVWIHEMNPRVGRTVGTDFEERKLLEFDTRAR